MYNFIRNKLLVFLIIATMIQGCNKDIEPPKEANIKINSQSFKIIQDVISTDKFAPVMVTIPAGSNTLGDITGSGISREQPTYRVTITKPFAIGKYEVTFNEYDFFCEQTGRKKPDDEAWGRGKHPVINVTWDDAHDYAKWLTSKTGQKYTLPSEAQWEYAARAGTQTNYWWGDKPGDKLSQCGDCAEVQRCIDCKDEPVFIEGTAIVGSYKANPFGLYDVHGNLAEWIMDCGNDTNSFEPSDGSPRLYGDCDKRMIKDGSWSNNVRFIRASVRLSPPDGNDHKGKNVGFRVAREINDK